MRVLVVWGYGRIRSGSPSLRSANACLGTATDMEHTVEDGANCTDQPAGKGRRAGTTPGNERLAPPGQTYANENDSPTIV